ncbi:MAG: alpha/beta hydrolase [Verrucomicrobiota bacterium]
MMKTLPTTTFTLLTFLIFAHPLRAAELPEEKPLWPEGQGQPQAIHYAEGETIRENPARSTAPSGKNRVFSRIAKPTYSIFRPETGQGNGVGVVICPGGGYTDVWLDREGHDLAIRLKEYGITSLVLKYRTNTGSLNGKRTFEWKDYLPVVISDAHQAITTLRSEAEALNLKPDRIGICGFSAGGHLALSAVLNPPR